MHNTHHFHAFLEAVRHAVAAGTFPQYRHWFERLHNAQPQAAAGAAAAAQGAGAAEEQQEQGPVVYGAEGKDHDNLQSRGGVGVKRKGGWDAEGGEGLGAEVAEAKHRRGDVA